MTRILFTILIICFISNQSKAQIVVDNSTFPEEGDTLFTTFASNAEVAIVGEAGGNKIWNFSALTGNIGTSSLYLEASEGTAFDLFPEADLVVKVADVQDVYIDVQDNKIIEIGRAGSDPLGFGLEANLRYTEMPVIRRAPLVYGSSFATDFEINFSIALADLPDSLGLNIPLVDSLRITIVSDIEGEIDAWGTMTIPDGEYEVLRLNNITETTTGLSAFSQLLGWITIDPATLPLGELGQLFEPRSTQNYVFYSNDAKEPIANVTVDENGEPTIAEYKGRSETLGNNDVEFAHLKTYPNPSSGWFTIELGDLERGKYAIEVLSMNGRLLRSDRIHTDKLQVYNMDLSPLNEDVFVVIVRNKKSQIVYSERVLFIK